MKFREIWMLVPRVVPSLETTFILSWKTRFVCTRVAHSCVFYACRHTSDKQPFENSGGYTNDGSESCTDRVRGEENNQAKGVTYIFAERRKAGCGTVHRDAREASSTLCGYTARKGGRIPIARYFQSGL